MTCEAAARAFTTVRGASAEMADTQEMQKLTKAAPMSSTHLTPNNYFDQTPYLEGT